MKKSLGMRGLREKMAMRKTFPMVSQLMSRQRIMIPMQMTKIRHSLTKGDATGAQMLT